MNEYITKIANEWINHNTARIQAVKDHNMVDESFHAFMQNAIVMALMNKTERYDLFLELTRDQPEN